MTDLTTYLVEELDRDGAFVLSRATGEGRSVLLLTPAADPPARGAIARLEHAFALRDEVDGAWAARPLELLHEGTRRTLVMEDPGVGTLARQVGTPMSVERFLRLAIGLTSALGSFHARGLIHRDLKAANVLVDPVSGRAWLTGIGLATRLPRQRQAPEPFDVITGTLSHLAPERTGRMNRSTDSRSDLYSVGVVFYEMLTGALPFTATSAIDWVHCHIARTPLPPHELRPDLPEAISSLVVKLLAKAAEDRYQTAAGLEADLRRCLDAWEGKGRVDTFALGERDAADHLLIPETLYGREAEIGLMLAAFDRVVTAGTTELVLVSGYSGIGKSSVVNELHKALVPPRGLFAAGKFDQYKRGIPYATLAQAFSHLVRQILAQSAAEVAHWKREISEALGPNGQLIVSLIPEVEHILGKQPPVGDLPPAETKDRFQRVLRRFIGVFARPEHPLALFLDDLQWLDVATLELIEHLIVSPDVTSLLLIGAYRDNEVDVGHPLALVMRSLRRAGAPLHEIVLAPLALRDVESLVADALRCDRAVARPLAELLREKTGGNPFFTIQFFAMLAEAGLLVFERGTWTWDVERIRAQHYTDNVVVLMGDKLGRLPASTQDALRRFACLGASAELTTLTTVCEVTVEALEELLGPALEAGLVVRFGRLCTFLHDRVQEAAYALVPESERAALHLWIGRRLAERTPDAEVGEAVFEILNQLNRGAALIDEPAERERVARLNLIAGQRARSSTAYTSALAYLAAGIALLPGDRGQRASSLDFDLELSSADCEFLTGEPQLAEVRLARLQGRVETLADRARVTCLQVVVYTALDRSDRAIGACFEYLRAVGIDWPMHPTAEAVQEEYAAIWRQLGDRRIEDLIDLPRIANPDDQATIDVLTAVQPAALYIDRNLNGLIVCRMVNLSLAHGNCDASCYAYVIFAMLLGPQFGAYDEAFRVGKLAFDLVETRGLDKFKARVLMCFGNIVGPWHWHAREGRPLVRRAFAAAQESGDLTFAVYSCHNLVTNLLVCGDPLEEVQRVAEGGFEFSRKARISLAVDFITGQLRLIMSLRGLLPTFGVFDDGDFHEATFEQHLASNPSLSMATCWYWIRKMQARFHAGAFAEALTAAGVAERLLWTSPSFLEVCDFHFYTALCHAAEHDGAPAAERAAHHEALQIHLRELENEALRCPANFENRAALVGAEIARIEGRSGEAMKLYERALRSSRQQGFVENEALAGELAAGFYFAIGGETAAEAHLRQARDAYQRWGALGKVRQLVERHPFLREDHAAFSAATSSEAAMDTSMGQLDFATVVKMSLAVSGEIVLDRLVEKLMILALEHAGAVRGLLVLPEGEELRIEAEATTGRDAVAVQLRRTLATADELPETILRFVARSRENVILGDALVPNEFSSDPYLVRKRTRSVLCLPLVKQTKILGVLYLENNLSPHVFTPPRIAVLQLLASQAAISLENARLYGNIQKAQAELAHVTRVTTMGELTASIAHEVSQPVAGVVINGNACLRWLARLDEDPQSLVEARAAVERIVRDGTRARNVIDRIRTLFKKQAIVKEPLDLNAALDEVLLLVRGEIERRGAALRRQLAPELPLVVGDRVQLQQVMTNLILNACDAMSAVEDRPRDLLVGTRHVGPEVVLFVTDSGIGLDPHAEGQLFAAFHTTKPDGLGMGLSISRSIMENHQGRLWAAANPGHGATFQLALAAAPPAT